MNIKLYCSSVEVRPLDSYTTVVRLDGVSEDDIVNEIGVSDLISVMDPKDISECVDVAGLIECLDLEQVVDAIGIESIMEHYDLVERGDKDALKDFSSEDLMKEALDVE